MTLLDKVKALFADTEIKLADTIFVKTKDGLIFSVKATELKPDVEIVSIDEAGAEQAIEDGDYTLEDGTILTIKAGKVAELATAAEETEEEVAAEEVVLEKIPAGDYTLDNGDSITIDENQVVVNWIKADVVTEEPAVEEMEKVEETTVNVEAEALKVELEKMKVDLEAKAKELASTKESFEKLQKQPATNPLDTRKFEKAENTKKESTLLSKVKEITNKK